MISGIHYYILQLIISLNSHQISGEECSCKENVIVNNNAFVCNICLALTTNLLAQ